MKKLALLISLVLSVSAFATDYTITGGYYGTKIYHNNDTLLMTGGGVNSLTAEDYSVLDIRNTSPFAAGSGGIGTLDLEDSSRLGFSGGQLNWFDIDDYATAALSGGKINKLENDSQGGYASVEIICKEYSYNSQTKKLTGIWGNDSAFNIQLADLAGYVPTYNILEFTIIPEPTTLLLLGLGGMLIRKSN